MEIKEYHSYRGRNFDLTVGGCPARVFKVSKEIMGQFRVGYYLEVIWTRVRFGAPIITDSATSKITKSEALGYLHHMPRETDLLFDDTTYKNNK
jgi:hypothetical protein